MSSHFENLDAKTHVVKRRVEGILTHHETHGVEVPGHIAAACDAARESAFFFALLWILIPLLQFTPLLEKALFLSFAIGLCIWKTGRSGWLGSVRLERLHRIIAEEKEEIENNREQEKEELKEMYRLKGFEGKLLDDVIDVISADGDRFLKVMLEEELGLTMEAYQHPFKQALGAFMGVIFAASLGFFFLTFFLETGIFIASFITMSLGAIISAVYEKNKIIPSLIWNLALNCISIFAALFFMKFLTQ